MKTISDFEPKVGDRAWFTKAEFHTNKPDAYFIETIYYGDGEWVTWVATGDWALDKNGLPLHGVLKYYNWCEV